MRTFKTIFLAINLALISSLSLAQNKITSLLVPTASFQTCDTVTVTIYGEHYCSSDVITGISHTVAGSIISITLNVSLGICIPPTSYPNFVTTYKLPLNSIASGTYTVRGYYNTNLFNSTGSLQVIPCCPVFPDAGNDSMFCDLSSYQLNGNAVPVGVTGNWVVATGGGTLNNPTLPNATLSNLSYGENKLAWTLTDAVKNCTVSDTLVLKNYESVTPAVTEADRNACYDTTTIHANPLMVGTGLWTSTILGNFLYTPKNSTTKMKMLNPGSKTLIWTVSNGACLSIDTLKIDYVVYTDTPGISYNAGTLSSTSAPSYQWYLNNVAVNGATSQSYIPVASGFYKVLAGEIGCLETGLYSNEIEVVGVGMEEFNNEEAFSIYPNPSKGIFQLTGLNKNTEILVLRNDMSTIKRLITSDSKLEVDCSDLNPGLYFVRVTSNGQMNVQRIVITR